MEERGDVLCAARHAVDSVRKCAAVRLQPEPGRGHRGAPTKNVLRTCFATSAERAGPKGARRPIIGVPVGVTDETLQDQGRVGLHREASRTSLSLEEAVQEHLRWRVACQWFAVPTPCKSVLIGVRRSPMQMDLIAAARDAHVRVRRPHSIVSVPGRTVRSASKKLEDIVCRVIMARVVEQFPFRSVVIQPTALTGFALEPAA